MERAERVREAARLLASWVGAATPTEAAARAIRRALVILLLILAVVALS